MAILLSFVAARNDKDHGDGDLGPNLNLFQHREFKTTITQAVFLYRKTKAQIKIIQYLKAGLKKMMGDGFLVRAIPWSGNDPTDHNILFSEMRKALKNLDAKYRGESPLWIHVSPGTPAMHAVWLLLAETGGVSGRFKLFKSYRKGEGLPPTTIDIHAELHSRILFYQKGSDDRVLWDGDKCRTAAMKSLFERAAMMARLNVPILILGERGCGKTTLAKWIRHSGPFQNQRLREWPTIVCGQYSDQLMVSELFGHKKGAFTGAYEDKAGLLSQLDGDTLFLDEIGDMSKNTQRLLIRAVEEKSYTPLGSPITQHSDFRLITATNLPFVELKKRLHPDFLDRVSVFTLEIPPLREIREELTWLWPQVFDGCRQKARLPSHLNLSLNNNQYIIKRLQTTEYTFPGNIRDLAKIGYLILAYLSAGKNGAQAIRQALMDFEGHSLKMSMIEKGSLNRLSEPDISFPESLAPYIQRTGEQFFARNSGSSHTIDSGRVINQVRKALARVAMNQCGNNKKKAAGLLQLKDGKSIDAWSRT